MPRYSGKEPELIDGDIFRIIIPLDDEYSYEVDNKAQNILKPNLKPNKNYALNEKYIIDYLRKNPRATQLDIAKSIGKSRATVQNTVLALKGCGILERDGAKKNGKWVVKTNE